MSLPTNLYPYTDFHQLNDDFILRRMKELEAELKDVKQEAIDAATQAAKDYVDSQLSGFLAEFNELKAQFAIVNANVTGLENQFDGFVAYVNGEIANIRAILEASIVSINNSVDQKITNAKAEIFTNLSTELSNIKVINYFTGDNISIQDMFNYLAQLHVSDSIDYNTMAARAKTYSQLALLNITFTNLAMHGNTLYI